MVAKKKICDNIGLAKLKITCGAKLRGVLL